jgi:hypothetical protein
MRPGLLDGWEVSAEAPKFSDALPGGADCTKGSESGWQGRATAGSANIA